MPKPLEMASDMLQVEDWTQTAPSKQTPRRYS